MRQGYAFRVAFDHGLLEFLEAQLAEALPVPLADIHASIEHLFVSRDEDVVELLELGVAHLLVQ